MPNPAAPVAAADVVETAAGYWWCSECRCEVSPQLVTYSEHHESCGHPVTWIEPAEASEIERLRAEVADMRDCAGNWSRQANELLAENGKLSAEVAELRKPSGETIGWSRETLAELMSARDQIATDRRCVSRDRCAARSTIFRNCDCMQSAVWRRTSR